MQVQSLKDRETIMEDTQNSIPAKKYDFFYDYAKKRKYSESKK